jgi:hypothetical protein
MSGGIYIVKRIFFMKNGAENEKFLGFGLEDTDRINRMESSGLPIVRIKGPLYHLHHPRYALNKLNDLNIERDNRYEFIKTCELC